MTAVAVGNAWDKHGATGPVARRLVSGFDAALDGLLERAAPASLLDVGCGEGVITQRWAARLPGTRVFGLDLEHPRLRAEWARRGAGVQWLAGRAERLPFADAELDLVAAVEVLEHVADPDAVLAEMRRVARRHLLVSVPREPLWRALNVARGAYLRAAGNTPGHRHHFSRRSLLRLLDRHGDVLAVRTPLPWTMALVRCR